MLNLGLGTTVLTKNKAHGYMDGIGVYTQELITQYHSEKQVFSEFSFYKGAKRLNNTEILNPFPIQCLYSAISRRPFLDSAIIESNSNLFHATDHLIPKLKNTPVIATIMDPVSISHPEWVTSRGRGLKNYLFKCSAQWAEKIITISEYSAAEIVQHFGISESKINVIPLGVNAAAYQRVAKEQVAQVLKRYQLPEKFYLNIGTLQPRKNIDRLITAYTTLPNAIQKKYPLVIVGRNGWGSEQLVKTLQNTNKNIRWLQYVSSEDKQALLQSSLALVFPSLYEGFGLPILEAFAAKTPVITSNITATVEVAGSAALLINPYSEQDISTAMNQLANDASMREELKKQGSLRVEIYTWSATASKTYKLYNSIVS